MTKKRYYKAAMPSGWDFYTGHTINYRDSIGRTVACPINSKKPALCSDSVLHASSNPLGVFVGSKIPCSMFVVEGDAVVSDEEKSGFKELKVLYEIPQENLNKLFGFNYTEASNPINPFNITPPSKITEEHLKLLKEWVLVWGSVRDSVCDSGLGSVRVSVCDSVWDSVWDLVWDSVWDLVWGSVWVSVWGSVRDSVCDSVRVLVRDSVRVSVWDSVWGVVCAYIGSMFPKIEIWKYCENVKVDGYPFQSAVTLWKMGVVPSFDGKVWRLHAGKDVKIVWEGVV